MLVNALSVVKSLYFYMKFSRFILITKTVEKGVRKISGYSQYTTISENILHSIL